LVLLSVIALSRACIQLGDAYVASLNYTTHEACLDEPFYENSTFVMQFTENGASTYAAVSGMMFSGSAVTTNAYLAPWNESTEIQFSIVTECWDFKTMKTATFTMRGYQCFGEYPFVMKHNARPSEAVYGEATPFCTACCSNCMATSVYDVPC
jgi:hypothetical protein